MIIAYAGDARGRLRAVLPRTTRPSSASAGLYLEDLFVRARVARPRRCGVALLTRLAQIAAERGCGRFEWSVLDWNEPQCFYKNLGAKPMHEWTVFRFTGDDFWRYRPADDGPAGPLFSCQRIAPPACCTPDPSS